MAGAVNLSLDRIREMGRQVDECEGGKKIFLYTDAEGITKPDATVPVGQYLEGAGLLLEAARARVAQREYRMLDATAREEVREYVDVAYRYLKCIESQRKKEIKGDPTEQARLKGLQNVAMQAKLGGCVSNDDLAKYPDLQQVVKANHLHHVLQAVCLRFTKEGDVPCLPIAIPKGEGADPRTVDVPVDQLTRSVEGDKLVYRYRDGGVDQIAFKTDKKGEFTDEYTVTAWGIAAYNSKGGEVMKPHMKLDPAGWNHEYRLCPMVLYGKGKSIMDSAVAHGAFALYTPTGDVYMVGQYGLFGGDGVRQPDPMVMCPSSRYQKVDCDIQITPDQFEAIKDDINRQRHQVGYQTNPMTQNCTSYLVQMMQKHLTPDQLGGMNIEKMSKGGVLELVGSFLLPKPFMKWVRNVAMQLKSGLPRPLFNVLHFVPPFYVFHTLFALLLKAYGNYRTFSTNGKLAPPKIDFVDVFFRPWKVTYHSPHRCGDFFRDRPAYRLPASV
ncbi:MAG: hypothetical protein S4CHLAM102_10310 [Chlamydiia bacterium]|nr:hypothetical protein [Chlamydiia bacterium]